MKKITTITFFIIAANCQIFSQIADSAFIHLFDSTYSSIYLNQNPYKDKTGKKILNEIAENPNLRGVDKAMFLLLSSQIDYLNKELFQILGKRERSILKSIVIRIDRDSFSYAPDRPVYINKIGTPPIITFETKWYIGLFSYILAQNISSNKAYKRPLFSFFSPYLKLANEGQFLAIETAELSEANNIDFNKPFNLFSLAEIFKLNLMFTYLHELAHRINRDFSEEQCDDYAIEKLIVHYSLNEKEFERLKRNTNIGLGLSEEQRISIMDKNLVNANVILNSTISLSFILSEAMLNPVSYGDVVSNIGERMNHMYKKASDLLKCNNLVNPFSNSGKYCILIEQMVSGYNENGDIVKEISNDLRVLIDSMQQVSLDITKSRSIKDYMVAISKFAGMVNPENPSGEMFFYGSYLLSLTYFNNEHEKLEEAKYCFIMGASPYYLGSGGMKSNDKGSREMCYLMLAELYKNKFHEGLEAIEYYNEAKEISIIFPHDFYENRIKSVK